MTIVDKDKTPEEITRCRRLTEDLGVTLRIRAYIPDETALSYGQARPA